MVFRITNTPNAYWMFHSCNSSSAEYRPILTVNYTTVHQLKFFKRSDFTFNSSTADTWISSGEYIIQTDDSTIFVQDYYTNTEIERVGTSESMPGDYSDNMITIDDEADALDIFTLLTNEADGEHRVYIVSSIKIKDEQYAGWAQVRGICILIRSDANHATLMHELGQNVGLGHTPEEPDYENHIMNPSGTNRCILRQLDKIYFENKYYCD